MVIGVVTLQPKPHFGTVGSHNDGLPGSESIHLRLQMEPSCVEHGVEASPDPVPGDNLQDITLFLQDSSETEAAEDGIVGNEGPGSPESPAIPQILLAGVVPGSPVVRLLQASSFVTLGIDVPVL